MTNQNAVNYSGDTKFKIFRIRWARVSSSMFLPCPRVASSHENCLEFVIMRSPVRNVPIIRTGGTNPSSGRAARGVGARPAAIIVDKQARDID